MTTEIRKAGQAIRVYFDIDSMTLHKDVIEIDKESDYKTYNGLIGSSHIDVVPFDEVFDIIIDDEGIVVSENPVFQVETNQGEIHLGGTLLFVKRVVTESGIDSAGMEAGEALRLLLEISDKVVPIGVTA